MTAQRACSVAVMPAFAIEMDCCSIAWPGCGGGCEDKIMSGAVCCSIACHMRKVAVRKAKVHPGRGFA